MTRIARPLCLILACALLTQAPVLAAEPPAAASAPAPDPDNLAIARDIIAVIMPPDRVGAMLGNVLESVMRPVQAQLQKQAATGDPKAAHIANTFTAKVRTMINETMMPMLPDMTDTMGRAYARMFTHDELVQIRAFAQTPTGAKYFTRAPELLQDRDVQAFYGRLMQAMQARQAKLIEDMKAEAAADAREQQAPTH